MIRECFHYVIKLSVPLACFTLMTGCRMGAPIHLWTPPKLQSTVGQTVMVPKVVGPDAVAGPLQAQLIQSAPAESGRTTKLFAAEALRSAPAEFAPSGKPSDNAIALVSYDQQDESDLALATAARSQKIDFVLRGEIIPDRRPRAIKEASEQLTVSWRLMPVGEKQQASAAGERMGMPVSVDLKSALKRYPDLTLAANSDAALQTALIRDTLPLITPSVQRGRAQLEIPYVFPGSRRVRRGNAMAVAGRWGEAERIWNDARERYPFSSVAIHNLAVAAVAKQDFVQARKLALKALEMKPTKLHQRTLVWVEQMQRAYHEAFDLPDPLDGWSVTRKPVPLARHLTSPKVN